MDWLNKSWIKEDEEFAPKRKIHNRGSKYHHHIIGSIYSRKMKRSVGYESLWGECLFYYFLELDEKTVRYYEQPVHVPIPELDKNGYPLLHVPDVLVFRQGYRPHLYQIKGTNYEISDDDFEQKNMACMNYALIRGWSYSVVYPRTVSDVVINNTLFLWNYLKPRKYFPDWIPEIKSKMLLLNEKTIGELARGFMSKTDHRLILPVIYHMICIGMLHVNLYDPITSESIVSIYGSKGLIDDLLELEDKI